MATHSKISYSGSDNSMSRVIDDDNLLSLVLSRVKELKLVLASSAVSKRWLVTVSSRRFMDELRSRCSPPVLGFISVFRRFDYTYIRFATLPGLSVPLGIVASRVAATFKGHASSRHEPVLFCRYDQVVVRQENQGGCYALRSASDEMPSSRVPPVDVTVPAWEGNTSRTTASFIAIGQDVAFFNELQQTATDAPPGMYVSVSQFIDGAWHTTASPILKVRYPKFIINRPYALTVDGTLFMMYAFGVIIAFKFATREFSLIKLPDLFECLVETEYRVARYGKRGLCILRVRGPELIQWCLDVANDNTLWRLDRTIWLPDIMHLKIGKPYWEHARQRTDNFYSIKILWAGDNGANAVLTFGFSAWFYYIDFSAGDNGSSTELNNSIDQDWLASVYPVTLPWPEFPKAD